MTRQTETERRRAAKRQEYLALRQYLKLAEAGGEHTTASRLELAIERELTPRQRQLVRMYYLRQMPMKDIAAELGITVGTASRTIKRGRERLKRCMNYGGRALLQSLRS